MVVAGGFVLLAGAGTAAAIKLSQKDAEKIEEHTGTSADELTEEELVAAMQELGIQSIELTDDDKATIANESGGAPPAAESTPPAAPSEPAPPSAPTEPEGSYMDELERLASLRDQGVINEEDFEAKKRQLLGLD